MIRNMNYNEQEYMIVFHMLHEKRKINKQNTLKKLVHMPGKQLSLKSNQIIYVFPREI